MNPGSRTDSVMVLIPVFNEAPSIAHVVAGCRQWDLPVVVVDDGSSDSTAEEAERAGARVMRHPENMGKGRALATGFDYASKNGFEAVITLDGDGQHDAAQIGGFIDEFRRSGADLIIGTRMRNVKLMPWLRRLTNRATSFVISKITGCRISDSQSGYRLVTVRAWREADPRTSRFDTEPELLIRAARRSLAIREVPISTIYRDGKSEIKSVRDAWRFMILVMRALVGCERRSVVE